MDKKKKKLDPPLPAPPPPNGLHTKKPATPSSPPSVADTTDRCPEPLYMCDICAQEGLTEAEMRTHVLLQHVDAGISCPFCDLEGTTLEQMNLHVNSVHLDYLGTRTTEVEVTARGGRGMVSKYSSLESSTSAATASSYATSDEVAPSCSSNSSSSADRSSIASTVQLQRPQQQIPWTTMSDDEDMDDSDSSVVPSGNNNVAPAPIAQIPTTENREQSLKRAKLHLDVPSSCAASSVVDQAATKNRTTGKFVPGNPNHNAFSCPFCPWATSCAKEIGQHVNSKHMDILSPAKGSKDSPAYHPTSSPPSSSGTTSDSCNNNVKETTKPVRQASSTSSSSSLAGSPAHTKFACPICNLEMSDSRSLERHVYTQHVDILSPGGTRSGGRIGGGGGTTPMSVGARSNSSSSMGSPLQTCPMCGMEFSDTDSLTQHADGHFSAEQTPEQGDNLLAQELERRELAALRLKEEREFEKMQQEHCSLRASKTSVKKFQQDRATLERPFYSSSSSQHGPVLAAVDDGHTCTRGVLPRLQQFYKQCPYVSRHWLASSLHHYAGAFSDKGWGCGYRNLQMLLSGLAENTTYERVLFNGSPLIPSIAKIQRLIEAAWAKGFDVQGCEQLGGRVVNTSKWIGATEIVATLSSLKVKCQLLDFHYPSGPSGTHPRLFDWVRDYFRRDTPFKPPLYLQHQGHSRTIIGVEEYRDGTLKLLIFDPSCSKRQMNQFVSSGEISNNLMKSLRRTMAGLKAKQYQIVAVVGLLQSDKDYEDSKLLKSERIPR